MRGHIQVLALFMIALILFGAFFVVTAFIPIHLSGVKQVIINIGGEQVGIGTAETKATIHYDDGSSEVMTGDTFTLNPIWKPYAAVAPQKNPETVDWENKVVYVQDIDLDKWCIKYGLIFWPKTVCPVDAMLVVYTDISITVDGEVKYESPSNGRYVAYTTKGAVSSLSEFTRDFWNAFGMDYTNVRLFQRGDITVPWSHEGWQVDPYRQKDRSVVVQVVGTQRYEMYPMYWWDDIADIMYTPHIPVPVMDESKPNKGSMIEPTTLEYSRPRFEIPALTVVQPDFILDISPSSLTISTDPANSGNIGFTTVYGQAYNSYTGTVQFGVRDFPSGVTGQYDRNNIAFTTTDTLIETKLTVTVSSTAKEGEYMATVTAAGTGLSEKTLSLKLTVGSKPQECPGGALCPKLTTVLEASSPSEAVILFPFQIKGTLTSPTGAGILGAKITATTDWGSAGSVATNQKGEFTMTMTAPSKEGVYNIIVLFGGDSKYAPSNQVELAISVRAVPTDWVFLIIIAIVAVVVIAVVGFALTRPKRPGMPSGGRM